MTTCSPSVSTQVCVSCGDPSGIKVATKQGAGLRSRDSTESGSVTAPFYPVLPHASYESTGAETRRALRLPHHQAFDRVLLHDGHELVDHPRVQVAPEVVGQRVVERTG